MRSSVHQKVTQDADLKQRCADAIRAILETTDVKIKKAAGSCDGGELILRGPWGKAGFVVEAKRQVTAETIRPLIAQMKLQNHRGNPLLMSEFINSNTAAILREEHVNFVDAAGNMYLHDPPLFVWQRGFKRGTPAHRPSRLFQVAGLKLLSVLLANPDAANASYRDLANRTGVSLGAIVPVFDDLAKGGFLRTTKQRRQLTRQRELLDQWVLGYAGQLFPRLILKTCRLAEGRSIEAVAETLRNHRQREDALVGGELAAGLTTGYLRPARATLHLPPDGLAKWMGGLRLVPDPAGNVDLLERFAAGNQWNDPPVKSPDLQFANPVLIYGELLRTGTDERLRETADILFQQFIAPGFRQRA